MNAETQLLLAKVAWGIAGSIGVLMLLRYWVIRGGGSGDRLLWLAKGPGVVLLVLSLGVMAKNVADWGSPIAPSLATLQPDPYWDGGINLTEAGRLGYLEFTTPASVVSTMRHWYPGWRDDSKPRAETLARVGLDWPLESIAFVMIWRCWPEITTWSPNRDPLAQEQIFLRPWPNFSRCARDLLPNPPTYGTTGSSEADKLFEKTLLFLRSRLISSLRTDTCRSTGASDCVLLLLQWSELFPGDPALAEALIRVRALYEQRPEALHENRRLALAKVEATMALAALASGNATPPLAKGIDLIEFWGPNLGRYLRLLTGVAPSVKMMTADEIRAALHLALVVELAKRDPRPNSAAATRNCCAYLAEAPLAPLATIERSPVAARAADLLAQEVTGLAGKPECNAALAEGGRHDGPSLFDQLAFLYAAQRAIDGAMAPCGRLVLPARTKPKPWLVDVPGAVIRLIGNEMRPWAHVAGVGLLQELCTAEPNDRRCERLLIDQLDLATIDADARFTRRTVEGKTAEQLPELNPRAITEVKRVLGLENCRPQRIEVWTSQRSQSRLVAADCNANSVRDGDSSRLLIAYRDGQARRLAIPTDSPADQSRELVEVTDADGDGRLELWFRVETDCEEEAAQCASSSLWHGEDFGGVLTRFEDARHEPTPPK